MKTSDQKIEMLIKLLITGGTDYHGIHTVTPRPVGAFTTHDEQIARLNDLAKARKSTFKRTT